MANTTVDSIKTQAVKPLYAVAGATEVAYEFATGYASVAQKTAQERLNEVQKSVSKLERDPKALQNQAVSAFNARVDELTKDAKKAQSAARGPRRRAAEGRPGAAGQAAVGDRRRGDRVRLDLRRPRRPWREDRRG